MRIADCRDMIAQPSSRWMLKVFVLVAGVASIATSAPEWRKPGNTVPVEVEFSRDRPEGASLRLKVTSNYDTWISVKSELFPKANLVAIVSEIDESQIAGRAQPEQSLGGAEGQTIISRYPDPKTESKIEVHTYVVRFVQVEKQDAKISMELSAGTGGISDETPEDAFVSMEILP